MEKDMYVTTQQGTANAKLQAHRQALGDRWLRLIFLLRIGTRALCLLDKHSAIEVSHEPFYLLVVCAAGVHMCL